MMKSNNTCQISALPKHINLSDMAGGLIAKERTGETLSEANTETGFALMPRSARIGKRRRREFIANVQGQCKDSPMIETKEDLRINKTEFERYQAGEIVVVSEESRTRGCESKTACSNQGPNACGYGWTNPFNPKQPIQIS